MRPLSLSGSQPRATLGRSAPAADRPALPTACCAQAGTSATAAMARRPAAAPTRGAARELTPTPPTPKGTDDRASHRPPVPIRRRLLHAAANARAAGIERFRATRCYCCDRPAGGGLSCRASQPLSNVPVAARPTVPGNTLRRRWWRASRHAAASSPSTTALRATRAWARRGLGRGAARARVQGRGRPPCGGRGASRRRSPHGRSSCAPRPRAQGPTRRRRRSVRAPGLPPTASPASRRSYEISHGHSSCGDTPRVGDPDRRRRTPAGRLLVALIWGTAVGAASGAVLGDAIDGVGPGAGALIGAGLYAPAEAVTSMSRGPAEPKPLWQRILSSVLLMALFGSLLGLIYGSGEPLLTSILSGALVGLLGLRPLKLALGLLVGALLGAV